MGCSLSTLTLVISLFCSYSGNHIVEIFQTFSCHVQQHYQANKCTGTLPLKTFCFLFCDFSLSPIYVASALVVVGHSIALYSLYLDQLWISVIFSICGKMIELYIPVGMNIRIWIINYVFFGKGW